MHEMHEPVRVWAVRVRAMRRHDDVRLEAVRIVRKLRGGADPNKVLSGEFICYKEIGLLQMPHATSGEAKR